MKICNSCGAEVRWDWRKQEYILVSNGARHDHRQPGLTKYPVEITA